MKLLEHVPGRGHVRVDGAQLAGLVGETDQVVVDMVPGGAVTSQGLVEGPQHLHGHQSHLSVVGHAWTTSHRMPGSMSQANIGTLQII